MASTGPDDSQGVRTGADEAAAPEAALPVLAIAGFGSMVAMRMCDAMLPALGASFGRTAAEASATVSAFAIAYGVMQLLAGPLGDRWGRPRIIALAAIGCSLAAAAAALAPTLHALVWCRALMGATAAGIIPLTIAWVGDQVPLERRQAVLARLLGYTLAGMMAGTWAGGAIADAVGWRWAFAASGAVLLAAGAVGLARRAASQPPRRVSVASHLRELRTLFADPVARRLYAVTALEGGLVTGVTAFLPSVLHERFGVALSSAGAALAVLGFGGLAYAHSAPRLLARVSPARLAGIGGGLLALAFAVLALMPHWVWAVPASLAAGAGFYMLHGLLQTCATQVSRTARGTAVSMFACVLFIGQSLGVAAMSAAFAAGHAAPCIAAAGLALLVLAVVYGPRVAASAAAAGG